MTETIWGAQAKPGATEFRFESRNVDVSANTIRVPQNTSSQLATATACTLSTVGTLPTGLAVSTTYYVIRVSATSIKLATSSVNANAGTAIDITGQGEGVHTLTLS